MQDHVIDRLHLVNGGRFDIWVAKVDMVGSFIREFKLKPVEWRHLAAGGRADALPEKAVAKAAVAAKQWWPWPWPSPGGLRIPHLHYSGEVYSLNEDQWTEFTRRVVVDIAEKLSRTEQIGYDQLMEVSQATGAMA